MESLTITLRNPKAKKLLKDLEDLNLITINSVQKSKDDFLALLDTMRTRNKKSPSLAEITKEVEAVRKKRHAKK
jgi:hypothetical protein